MVHGPAPVSMMLIVPVWVPAAPCVWPRLVEREVQVVEPVTVGLVLEVVAGTVTVVGAELVPEDSLGADVVETCGAGFGELQAAASTPRQTTPAKMRSERI